MLRCCSYCNGSFGYTDGHKPVDTVTHGVCPRCHAAVTELIDRGILKHPDVKKKAPPPVCMQRAGI